MATNTYESAVVLCTADNQIEIIRASAVRRLIATTNEIQLVVIDEHNHPWLYVLDVSPFENEEDEDDPEQRFAMLKDKKRAEAIASFFGRVLGGEMVRVKTRQRVHAAAELLAE